MRKATIDDKRHSVRNVCLCICDQGSHSASLSMSFVQRGSGVCICVTLFENTIGNLCVYNILSFQIHRCMILFLVPKLLRRQIYNRMLNGFTIVSQSQWVAFIAWRSEQKMTSQAIKSIFHLNIQINGFPLVKFSKPN